MQEKQKCFGGPKALLLLFCGLFFNSTSLYAQPAGWVEYNGHSYRLTATESTWTAAELEAAGFGGHLVAINSAGEQQFLNDTFLIGSLDSQFVWMGINDVATEGNFVWSNGDSVSYTNWHPGEPNDWDGVGGEDYGCMNWHREDGDGGAIKGDWNDCDNDGTRGGPAYGIIEISSVIAPGTSKQVPAIGIWGLLGLITLLPMLGLRQIRRKLR